MASVPENVWDRTEHILSILNAAAPRSIAAPRPTAPPAPRSWRDTADGILAQLERLPESASDAPPDFGLPTPDDLESAAPSSDSAFVPHPWPAPEDLPPRIVAVLPHRGDRRITDEILARLAETEGAHALQREAGYDTAGSPENSRPPVQVAQAPVPWNPYFGNTATSNWSESGGYIPATARNNFLWKWLTGRREPPLEGVGGYSGPSRTYESTLRGNIEANRPAESRPAQDSTRQSQLSKATEHFQQRYYDYLRTLLRQRDANHPELERQPTGVPSSEQIRQMQDAIVEATIRTGRPYPRPRGGESFDTILGDSVHLAYPELYGYGREWILGRPLPSGRRVDLFREEPPAIRELKPSNPPAIRRGERQLERYADELESLRGVRPATKLDTYDPIEILRRFLGLSE